MKWQIKILKKKEFNQAEQELKILEDEVAATYDFLCKNRNSHFSGKKKIPIYLLLGPSRFGKTTILSQAGLNLKNIHHQTLENIVTTKYCSFWISQDAIYIDTAGTYTKPEIAKLRNDLIWQGFIKLLQKYFGKHAIAGVLIVLDLPAIAQDADLLKKTLLCIRERTYELATFIRVLPLHIIFTKSDRILGFTEFFSLFDTKNRLQPFGMAFTDHKDKIDPVPKFETKFNELIKRLNEHVVERLQKASQLEDRLMIRAFPSQLNSLRQLLLEVLSKIPSGRQILLSGIYFTSSIQDGAPIDFTKKSLLDAFNLKEKPAYSLEANSRYSYFVEDIFKKVITAPPIHKKQLRLHLYLPKIHLNYLYALLTMGLIVGTSSFIGYQSYNKNIVSINDVKYFLQIQSGSPNIDNLYAFIVKLDQTSKSWWLRLGISETKSLQYALQKMHQTLFTQVLALQIENSMNTEINSPKSTSDPIKLYDSLQAYLMLGDTKKLDQTYIKNWFNNYWSNLYSDSNVQKITLQQQLQMVLQFPIKIGLNQQIIAIARDSLNNMPTVQLAYLLLRNTYAKQYLKLDSIKPISKMYTLECFNKIYNEKIPQIAKNLPQQNWVMGDQLKLRTIDISSDTIKNLKKLYLEKYVATWEAINYDPKIDSKNLDIAAKNLEALASSTSPLIKLLRQIEINTNTTDTPLIKEVNTKLRGISTDNLANLQGNLARLAIYFSTIAQSLDPDKAAFEAVINHLHNDKPDPLTALITFSEHQPPQLQKWLQLIVNKSWEALLNAAPKHINKMWSSTITPQYKKMLTNKYPLFKDSKDDISLNDFNRFFGPYGIIDNFFDKYIKPFVNTDKTDWSWKNLDGQKISLSQDSLEVFLRAALIQKMFYPHKSLNPKLQFTLTPIEMTPDTQSFTIHLEGQKITFAHEEKNRQELVWPGPNPGMVTIDFITHQGKYSSISQFGPWAWFKMLDKANVISTSNTEQFILTFDLNGNAIKYGLSTSEPINPFIPEIISNFRCQDQLS